MEFQRTNSTDGVDRHENKNRIPITRRGVNSSEMVNFGKAATQLRSELANFKYAAIREKDNLNNTVNSLREDLRTQEANSEQKISHLEKIVHELRIQLADSESIAKEVTDRLNATSADRPPHVDLHAQKLSERKVADLEKTVQDLRVQLSDSQRLGKHARDRLNGTIRSLRTHFQTQETSPVGSLIWILHAHEKKLQCEALYGKGRILEAALSFLEITRAVNEGAEADKLFMDWLPKFIDAYSAALSLGPSNPNDMLTKWASTVVLHTSTDKAFSVANKFNLPSFFIHRAICEALESNGRVKEAIACFRQMHDESSGKVDVSSEQTQWALDFQRRCVVRLEELGDAAIDSQNYDEGVELFSTRLSLHPVDSVEILLKRSKAYILLSLWEEALNDADEAIKLEPSSHRSHEMRYATLHGAGRHA
ncbi:hypothetical protein JVU11DRAFT_10308 [Chiua virens]|nr:hypothetical protein JVU11DRAFT_10308 [Chiua virens]